MGNRLTVIEIDYNSGSLTEEQERTLVHDVIDHHVNEIMRALVKVDRLDPGIFMTMKTTPKAHIKQMKKTQRRINRGKLLKILKRNF